MQKLPKTFLLVFILTLSTLIASVALNVILFVAARHYYLLLNQTSLDPLGLEYIKDNSRQVDRSNDSLKKLVFFGDSRAQEWTSHIELTGFSMINGGISGQTSTQVLGRFEKQILPLRPQIILVQVGINDLKAIPLFPDRKNTIIANCKANIQEIVKRSRSLGATVILTTVIPAGEIPLERKPFWSSEIDRAVVEVNSYIHSLQAPNLIILDSYSLLEQNRKNNYQDTLHLNSQGYEILNKELIKVLTKLK
ncbi:SGNH/GDSL hydrolase family protein [Floridanema evergladense]|uniref:SGNH/GDSL hydrolase family protein n=1 Tax=Floridaenema evergladense BLCC-F167 TaxID=3153639 RepID=A0ABV4WXE2_9CYAN